MVSGAREYQETEESVERILDQPAYIVAEAGRLTSVTASNVNRWIKGYSYNYQGVRREQPPIIKRGGAESTPYLSFLDLIDILFMKEFLNRGFSLRKLRNAFDEARHILQKKHFAHETFFTDGNSIYTKVRNEGDAIIELMKGGQWAIKDVIASTAQQLDFEELTGLACKWYPLGKDGRVVVDPAVSFGQPHMVGKRITTANVYDMYRAEGEKIRTVCRWLELTQPEVRAAVRYEKSLAA